jgi:hypothetical protein
MVGSRGFEPRSARSERAASASCATSRCGDHGRIRTATWTGSRPAASARVGLHGHGPSGWTRTTTSRVKSPACCVDTTKGMELMLGIEPRRRPYQSPMLPLHHISVERMIGFEPIPQGLEGPQAAVTPHSLWFGLPVSNRSLRGGTAECFLHTQAEHGPAVRRSTDIRQLSKTPLVSRHTGGQQGIRTQASPLGRSVLQTASGPSARAARFWRQCQDSNPDLGVLEAPVLPLHHTAVHVLTVSGRSSLSDLAQARLSREAKTKKAF